MKASMIADDVERLQVVLEPGLVILSRQLCVYGR